MICRKCGNEIPSNTRHCICCGAPIYAVDVVADEKKKQKTAESVVVSLIIVLVLALVIAVGVYIYENNSKSSGNFGGSGGDSGANVLQPTTKFPVGKLPPTPEKSETPSEEDVEKPKQEEPKVPKITQQEKMAKKDEFLEEADDIILYSEMYLETADNQYEINSESGVVFQKWDDLLNEVYRYLETIMNEREFRKLEEEEIEWVIEKEAAIEAAGVEWQGGTGEIMARNMTAISYTEERCYYLISLIN